MAQQFNTKEIKQFKKELSDALKAIEILKNKDVVRMNETRLGLIIAAKNSIKAIETDFDNSLVN